MVWVLMGYILTSTIFLLLSGRLAGSGTQLVLFRLVHDDPLIGPRHPMRSTSRR